MGFTARLFWLPRAAERVLSLTRILSGSTAAAVTILAVTLWLSEGRDGTLFLFLSGSLAQQTPASARETCHSPFLPAVVRTVIGILLILVGSAQLPTSSERVLVFLFEFRSGLPAIVSLSSDFLSPSQASSLPMDSVFSPSVSPCALRRVLVTAGLVSSQWTCSFWLYAFCRMQN